MMVKIYVNESDYEHSNQDIYLPKVLSEKQYEELFNSMVAERMKPQNIEQDDGFDDWLGCDYSLVGIFFMKEEEKKEILKEFEERVRQLAIEELNGYYEEYEIEI